MGHIRLGPKYDTIRYDTRCYFNVRSKADMSRFNLPHGNDSLGNHVVSPEDEKLIIIITVAARGINDYIRLLRGGAWSTN